MVLHKKKLKKADIAIGGAVLIILALVGIAIGTMILNYFFGFFEPTFDRTTCRGSVALRADVNDAIGEVGQELTSRTGRVDLLCKTEYADYPYKAPVQGKEKIKEDIARDMADCWWKFGEGYVQNPFVDSIFSEQKCFQCVSFTVQEDELNGETISMEEFRRYLFENTYRTYNTEDGCHRGGGNCVETENDCNEPGWSIKSTSECGNEDNNYCCYHSNECINHGGSCVSKDSICSEDERVVNKWCSSESQKCCAPSNVADTYLEYFQFRNGKGAVAFEPNLNINSEDAYGIAFMGSHRQCDGTCALATLASVGPALTPLGAPFMIITNILNPSNMLNPITSFQQFQRNPDTQYIVVGSQNYLNEVCPPAGE